MSAFCLSLPLPGLGVASRAPWPVWRDSTRKEVRFQPLPKRQAVKLYHHARRLERQTRARNRQDGAIGRNGLLALHALLFDFMHYASGRLDPSIKAIARAANISESSVKRGLVKLKAAGVVTWLRRCAEDWVGGRFVLRQQTNAYGVLPASQWRGYAPPAAPPAPFAESWGHRRIFPISYVKVDQTNFGALISFLHLVFAMKCRLFAVLDQNVARSIGCATI
jgi:hypothetical protein